MFVSLPDIAQWAWARHHNILSWYIRPVVLVPMGYFAWRRSLPGIAFAFLALLSSMAWFPPPAASDPRIVALLAAEKDYLLGPWPGGSSRSRCLAQDRSSRCVQPSGCAPGSSPLW